MNVRVIAALLAAVVCTGVMAAQQPTLPAPQSPADAPPVTFRVEANYVEVDAFVTDAQGNVISNLGIDDFDVLEDGKAQKVTAFSHVDIPIERAARPLFAARPIESDVQTNTEREGRIYLIVLDDVHIDATRAPRVKAAARRFIERNFGANDTAAVVFTGGRASSSQDFTNNPRLLLRAIDTFTGRKLRSATLERLDAVTADPSGNVVLGRDAAEMERGHLARNAMNTIRQLSEFMAGVRGRRKSILLISEGVDYDIFNVIGTGGNGQPQGPTSATAVLEDTRDAVAAAQRGNVTLYAIDPRGLATGGDDLIETSFTLPEQGAGLASLQSELRMSQDSLRTLAAETGGFAAVNQNDLNSAFDRIVRENSSYYVLGYYSTNDRRDGRYRKLVVRVKRPGALVRNRNGYIEARGRAKAPTVAAPVTGINAAVVDALGSPLPMTGVPLRVFAAPYKGTAPNAAVAVAVEIDTNKFTFVEKDGTFNEQVNMMLTATNTSGKIFPGDRHSVTLTLKPDTYERVKRGGVRVVTQLALPPGRYQVRVAAGNASGEAGSALYDLEVPDFYKSPFVMSGVSLTSMASGDIPTVKAKDPLGDFLPGPPMAFREFVVGDTLSFFAEFYENADNVATHVIDLKADIRGEDGQVVREVVEERSSAELRGGGGGYGFSARLPLSDLTPGLYVLHVEGRSRAGDRLSASRDVLIRIR